MRAIVHPSLPDVPLSAVLHALGDPARLQIVKRLSQCPGQSLTCTEAWCGLLPRSTLTHHLNVLRQAGLIETVPQGTARLNRLRTKELEARFPGLLKSVLRHAP